MPGTSFIDQGGRRWRIWWRSSDDVDKAQEVMQTIGQLVKEHSLELDDAVIVKHKEGGMIKLPGPR